MNDAEYPEDEPPLFEVGVDVAALVEVVVVVVGLLSPERVLA